MATESIDRVRELQQGALEPGEYYTAAVRVRWKTGMLRFLGPGGWLAALARKRHPGQVKLPMEGIWATTDRRLLVFESDRARRVKPTTLVTSFPLGPEAYLISVGDPEATLGAGGNWTYLTVSLAGRQIEVEAPAAEAAAMAHALRGYGPDRPARSR